MWCCVLSRQGLVFMCRFTREEQADGGRREQPSRRQENAQNQAHADAATPRPMYRTVRAVSATCISPSSSAATSTCSYTDQAVLLCIVCVVGQRERGRGREGRLD